MGEFEGGGEAGLLVQAAEVTDKVDDGVLFFEGFIGQGIIEVVEGLFDLVGIVGAHMLVSHERSGLQCKSQSAREQGMEAQHRRRL